MRCSVIKNWIAGVLLLLSVNGMAAVESRVATVRNTSGSFAAI